MKLLNQAVLVPVPEFEVATAEGVHKINFNVLFARQSASTRKKRMKDLRTSMRLMQKQSARASSGEITDEELDDIQNEVDASDDKYDAVLSKDILGWSDLHDVDGTTIEYSSKMKKVILDSDPFRKAILAVWKLSSGGVDHEAEAKANLKN